MSTETLHHLLDLLENNERPTLKEVAQARAEVAGIEKLACFLVNVDTTAGVTREVALVAAEGQALLERIAMGAVARPKLKRVPVDPVNVLCECGHPAGVHASRGPGACGPDSDCPCERYMPRRNLTPGRAP